MILDEILAYRRLDLARQKDAVPLRRLERLAAGQHPAVDLCAALRRGEGPVRLIAEVKRASPSKGPLRPDLDPASLAREYALHGAAAVSVLTESRYFKGGEADMRVVCVALDALGPRLGGYGRPPAVRIGAAPGDVPGGLPGRHRRTVPVLRKDFVFDPYQVVEARAWGADALLLIVAILDDSQLVALLDLTRQLGMSALVETHDAAEVGRALAAGARIVGINNRDLHTFRTDLATTETLRSSIPDDRLVVAESGIRSRSDVARLARCGVDAILVGEALVTSSDVGSCIRELIAP